MTAGRILFRIGTLTAAAIFLAGLLGTAPA
jgi:hypothetical protein